MANDENKTELFCMMANALVTSPNNDKVIVSTRLETVISNKLINTSALQPCNQEEADTRIFLHVKNIITRLQQSNSDHCRYRCYSHSTRAVL